MTPYDRKYCTLWAKTFQHQSRNMYDGARLYTQSGNHPLAIMWQKGAASDAAGARHLLFKLIDNKERD